jgi:Ran GTPase-activating protein (RanGAP) involved in mRNA processing and transport
VYYLAAAALAAGVVLWTYRTFISGAAKHAASSSFEAIAHGVHQKKLQREAASRLNDMSSLLQNSPTADLSAKSLGDEGTAYVVEALAFNTVCLAADFSNNGMGKLGIAQLSEVLPTCALQHLKLHTNNLGRQAGRQLIYR